MVTTPDLPSSAPSLSLVVAAAENDVIGCRGELPWRLSGDLKRFKQLTMGHALIMGRKTFDSIGRALPGRVSIVLTRSNSYTPPGERVLVVGTLEAALAQVAGTGMDPDEAFVVGGSEIYQLALPNVDRLYLTRVHASVEGDAYLPEIDFDQWQLVDAVEYAADDKNEYACTWQRWQRVAIV